MIYVINTYKCSMFIFCVIIIHVPIEIVSNIKKTFKLITLVLFFSKGLYQFDQPPGH